MERTVAEFDQTTNKIPPPRKDGTFNELQFTIKDGMDGAGNQLKIMGQSSASMELIGYVLLEVHDVADPVSYFCGNLL